jgi:hypothetical protein
MTTPLQISIQSLLSEKDGKVSAAMSPMLFFQEVSKSTGLPFNRLARVWLGDERINQMREDGGYTGHDTLLLASQYQNDLMLTIWVDTGVGGIPIAMGYQSDREVLMTTIYEREKFVRKLTESEVRAIFEAVYANPSLLAIGQEE